MADMHELLQKLTDWRDKQEDLNVTLEAAFSKGQQINDVFEYGLTDSQINDVVDELMQIRVITQEIGMDVIDRNSNHKEWYEEWANQSLEHTRRWGAYNRLLADRGWATNVRGTLNKETSRIVDLMGDPKKEGPWQRRGLVIGEVQSGKTATYIGVLNKALDAGYRFVVILGGHTNDLRKQTQARVDSDLIGKDSSYLSNHIGSAKGGFQTRYIGVGANSGVYTQVLTTVDSDFNQNSKIATAGISLGGDPIVAVIKKRAQTINNLTTYLIDQSHNGILDEPIAVIDDEADWASVNTRKDDEAAAVNRAIRDLLNVSTRSSYMAITATPFANVFIDHRNEDDLFPRNYIRALNAPSNYIGVDSYFTANGREKNPEALRSDIGDVLKVLPFKHKADAQFNEVPGSLRKAIASFILATAIRRMRDGKVKPSSMMINISRFNAVQERIHKTITDYVDALSQSIKFGSDGEIAEPERVRELRFALELVYGNTGITWEEILPMVKEVSEEVKTELVNASTMSARKKRLAEMTREERENDELTPKIFIGGNILARGLTLEGLVVSYYLRKTAAADTLLQMGRWFGYRPGYEDLVRIWTDPEIVELFAYSADISASLRRSIGEMNDKELTPEEFGLTIKQHPESFRITALNKSRSGQEITQDVRIYGHVFESHMLPLESELLQKNIEATNDLADALLNECSDLREGTQKNSNIWRGVPRYLVKGFLESFKGHAADPYFGTTDRPDINKLVDALEEAEKLDEWNVVFVNGGSRDQAINFGSDRKIEVRASMRNTFEIDDINQALKFSQRRVASANDLYDTLPEKLDDTENPGEKLKTASQQYVIDKAMTDPTLMIYGVRGKEGSGEQREIGTDIVGISVAFPHRAGEYSGKAKTIKVIANTVYMQMMRDENELANDDVQLEED